MTDGDDVVDDVAVAVVVAGGDGSEDGDGGCWSCWRWDERVAVTIVVTAAVGRQWW